MADARSPGADELYASVPERPSSWYHDAQTAEAAQVQAQCAQAVPIHHQEVLAAHAGSYQHGKGAA